MHFGLPSFTILAALFQAGGRKPEIPNPITLVIDKIVHSHTTPLHKNSNPKPYVSSSLSPDTLHLPKIFSQLPFHWPNDFCLRLRYWHPKPYIHSTYAYIIPNVPGTINSIYPPTHYWYTLNPTYTPTQPLSDQTLNQKCPSTLHPKP